MVYPIHRATIKKKERRRNHRMKYALLHRATIEKKKNKKTIEITGQKCNGLPYSIGQP